MEPRTLHEICSACGGVLLRGSGETIVRGVSTDSRQIRREDLFVALEGDRFDGHQFVAAAAGRGAAAVLVRQAKLPAEVPACAVVAVEQTRGALGRLAAVYRRSFRLPVIAVGGSNGKTTTKELTASILSERWRTLRSESSFNNDIGVPLTLLRLQASHQVAVVELGTNHPGELAPLIRMAEPSLGVMTSIGREHLEFFGGLDGVIEEEGWLAELLPDGAKLFIHGDCPALPRIVRRTAARVVRAGWGPENDWRACSATVDDSGTRFEVIAPDAAYSGEYRTRLIGRHQVINALLAIAAGQELGLEPGQIRDGLEKCEPPKMRLQLKRADDLRILDDTYNANADSMGAALQALGDLPCRGRRVAVLGDMAELGAHSEAAHAEVGRQAAALRVDHLFAVGKMAPILGQSAREAGLEGVTELATVDAACEAVRGFVQAGDLVLLKASRSARLERIAEDLQRGVYSESL